MLTAQLDPLVEPEITRAAGLLTPPNGPLLDGRITIRRKPQTDGPKYPKAAFILQSGDTSARISLPQGQSRMPFPQIAPQLPPAWKQGLPPGEYTLQSAAGPEGVAFSVEDDAVRRQATRHLAELRRARLGPDDPLYVQVAVEQFMNHKDGRNRDRPYSADALDALENLPDRADSLPPPAAAASALAVGRGPETGRRRPRRRFPRHRPVGPRARVDRTRAVVASAVRSPRPDAIAG